MLCLVPSVQKQKMLEIEEGPRVLGLGLGLFLLILHWSFTLLIVLLFFRLSSGPGIGITSVALIITGILLAFPRHPPKFKDNDAIPEEEEAETEVFKIYDHIFIWRVFLLLFMSCSALVGTLLFCNHCMEPIYAQPIKKIKL